MKKYIVYDTTDHPVGVPFNTWEDAETYKIVYGRPDWSKTSNHRKEEKEYRETEKGGLLY